MKRAVVFFGVALLGGCGAAPAPGETIACASELGERRCTVAWTGDGAARALVIGHPEIGYRRFRDGPGGLVPADGAERVARRATPEGTRLSVGGVTYDLPTPR